MGVESKVKVKLDVDMKEMFYNLIEDKQHITNSHTNNDTITNDKWKQQSIFLTLLHYFLTKN